MRTLSKENFYTIPDNSALLILHKQSSDDDNCNRYTYCDQFDEEASDEEVSFELNPPVKFTHVIRTTLTGNDKKSPSVSQSLYEEHNSDISDNDDLPIPLPARDSSKTDSKLKKLPQILSNLKLEPMALEAFRVDF